MKKVRDENVFVMKLMKMIRVIIADKEVYQYSSIY